MVPSEVKKQPGLVVRLNCRYTFVVVIDLVLFLLELVSQSFFAISSRCKRCAEGCLYNGLSLLLALYCYYSVRSPLIFRKWTIHLGQIKPTGRYVTIILNLIFPPLTLSESGSVFPAISTRKCNSVTWLAWAALLIDYKLSKPGHRIAISSGDSLENITWLS